HVPGAKRKKIDDRSEAMILVGYHAIGAYKLYDPVTKKMMFSRDVIVDEAKSWDWISGCSISKSQISSIASDEIDSESSNDEAEAPNVEVGARSTRVRHIPARLQECELVNDNEITEEGDLVHIALLAGASLSTTLKPYIIRNGRFPWKKN
ncbi:copia-type polyprotein, partial [Trifolium medium]|nr:copia-type polyprotein [Trifolium medium]